MKFTFAPDAKPLPGYTIKRAIYRGGFGEVYFAVTDAGREVALKLLQNNADIELRGVQQCLNLSHPNLVTIFDIIKDQDGDHWVVMEYVAGQTLEAMLRQSPQGLPVDAARHWLKGLAAGIDFLHARGLVHRDLKPANLFLDNGIVKIGDVGLSKYIAPSQRSAQTQSVGTVYYMAPEVAKGSYGREVDVYATGVILYELLTGDVPFDGESTGEILMKHLTSTPDLKKLPQLLRPIVAKALHKSPEQRYQSVGALLADFEEAITGPSSRSAETEFESRRRRKASACGTAGGHYGDRAGDIPQFASDQNRRGWTHEHWNFWQPYWLACSVGAKAKFQEHAPSAVQALEQGVYRAAGFIDPFEEKFRRVAEVNFTGLGLKLSRIALIGMGTLSIVFGLMLMVIFHLPWLFLVPVGLGASIFFAFAASLSPERNRERHSPVISVPASQEHEAIESVKIKKERRLNLARALGMASLIAPLALLLSGMLLIFKRSMFLAPLSDTVDVHLFGWFVLVAIVAGWFVSVLRWLQSNSPHTQVSRLLAGALGALTGAIAWDFQRLVGTDMQVASGEISRGALRHIGDFALYVPREGMTLAGFCAFFAALFAIRNWARVTAPSRSKRFSVWTVLKTVLLAWLLTLVLPFPVQWGLAWAAVISCTVQLASPGEGSFSPTATKVQSRTVFT